MNIYDFKVHDAKGEEVPMTEDLWFWTSRVTSSVTRHPEPRRRYKSSAH